MAKNRAELLEKIEDNIYLISNNRNAVMEIKEELAKYRISEGRVEKYFSDPELLEDTDVRELALLTEQIYVKTGLQGFNPDNYFTEHEMKEARQYDHIFVHGEEEVVFPLDIENVIHIGNNLYVASLDIQTIAKLMKSKKLNYNFEIQRQETKIVRKDKVMRKPTIYKKNVKEIKELLKKDQLIHTTLAFNAAPDVSGETEELTYNSKRNVLTINEGTRLDILDGYHRCLASQQAIAENPDLNFKFVVMISNYTTRQAQQYQAQLAQATPIPTGRVQELQQNKLSDTVVGILKSESELRGRVSSSGSRMNITAGELVSYRVLSDVIDREFQMKTLKEARETAKDLAAFFENLIGLYPEEFLESRNQNESIMAYNKMFAGYVGLAAEMKKQKIDFQEMKDVLDKIDFSKDNPLWKELNIITSEGKINNQIDESKISKYFRGLL
jgi:hypothetical protein